MQNICRVFAIITILFGAATIARAQTLNSWMYQPGQLNGFGDALITTEGDLLLTGYSRSDSVNSFFIGKWTFSGDSLWSHSFTMSNSRHADHRDYVPGALLEVNDGYLLCGYWTQKAFIIKTSKDGDFLWQRFYKLTEGKIPKMEPTLMRVTSGGRILISGRAGGDLPDNGMMLMTIDSMGNVQRLQGIVTPKELFPVSLLTVEDGGSIVVATVGTHFDNTDDDTYPQIFRYNENDSLLFTRKYILPFQAGVSECIATADGNYVLVGSGSDSIFIMKLDPSFQLLSLKSAVLPIEFHSGNYPVGLASVAMLPNGDFILTGNRAYHNSMIIRINAKADVLFAKIIDSTRRIESALNKILLPSDGTIWLAGDAWLPEPSEKRNIFITACDEDGNTFCNSIDTLLKFHDSALRYSIEEPDTTFLLEYNIKNYDLKEKLAGNLVSSCPLIILFQTFYADTDNDGFGDINSSYFSPNGVIPAGYVIDSTDCDDSNPNVHPEAKEIPNNGIDDNCNGQIDEGPTGVNEVNISSLFSILPNPTNGLITVQATLQQEKSLTIRILDLAGKELYSENLGNANGSFFKQLDLSSFSPGSYFIQLIPNGQAETRKLILLQNF